MSSASRPRLIAWLRATGEPSRLRLLSLCGQSDLSVSDLARALGQSEPRVSRHLRILCDAGLIDRVRQGQWVHYRLASHPGAAAFARGLLSQLDRNDVELRRDLERAQGAQLGPGGAPKASESRLGKALRGFMEAHAPSTRVGSVLLVGVEHLELLEIAASMATECTAIAHSRRAAQGARSFVERTGGHCRVLLAARPAGLSERDLVRAGHSFDAVILDQLATSGAEFAAMLALARRALLPSGHLWMFERYESLELSREKVIEHPLARLRRLLGELGLKCERLSPIEAEGEHVLAAVAAPLSNTEEPSVRRA